MQDVLETMRIECESDVKSRAQTSKERAYFQHKKDMPLVVWLVLFMLVTTLIYMAWSINKIHEMNHSINAIHQEKTEADRKADLFFEAVRKKQKK